MMLGTMDFQILATEGFKGTGTSSILFGVCRVEWLVVEVN
jgi:hypothetical protein